MQIQLLLTKLFAHHGKEDEIVLEVSDAIAQHKNPVGHIELPINDDSFTEGFLAK